MRDSFFTHPDSTCSYSGYIDSVIRHIEHVQLMDPALWHRFVMQFSTHSDSGDAGWRGEYWGKLMRGACFVYSYTHSSELYAILRDTVCEMMEVADEDGRISTYSRRTELDGWDLWCRKYVLLGMQYFLELCDPDAELRLRITQSMCRQVDCIMARIGREQGKKAIISATRNWRGLNSCSILEPVMRLYNITGEQRFLDFASYIVSFGGTGVSNLFDLAYDGGLYPYQYPVTKAYEMISCFQGLLEYYRVIGDPRHRTAVINFADRLLESDFTVIGCSGCTHELFDHSTVRQANTTNGITMQETCVSVTLMKFFYDMLCFTGDVKYADAFECTLYNAYLGAINTESRIDKYIVSVSDDARKIPLPFDSYSPLTPGIRGSSVGGLKFMDEGYYYGCCACIAPMGCGLIPYMQLMQSNVGPVVNLYISGTVAYTTPSKQSMMLTTDTAYPAEGGVRLTVSIPHPEQLTMTLRIPGWSGETRLTVNGAPVTATSGYLDITRIWNDGDTVELILDMRTEVIHPVEYGTDILMNNVIWHCDYIVPTFDRQDPRAPFHVALRRGPIMLAADSRLGRPADMPAPIAEQGGYADARLLDSAECPYPSLVYASVPLTDGTALRLTDYASAGKTWDTDSLMAVWIPTV